MLIDKLEILTLVNGPYSCQILTNYGAALNSYRFGNIEFVQAYNSPEETKSQQYKSVLLAPFPNRLADAKYTFEQNNYTLAINREKEGLALHGFLYNRSFDLLESEDSSCALQYDYLGDTQGFPFPFQLNVFYNLNIDGSLEVLTKVKNLGKENMPFGLGWHPYFQFNKSIDKLKLKFPATDQLILNERKIPTGTSTCFTEQSKELDVKDYKFDDCFKLSDKGLQSFILCDDQHELKISANQSSFPYFQIYTPTDRTSVAIEPMTCAPNAFNNLIGLKVLQALDTMEASYTIKASRLSN